MKKYLFILLFFSISLSVFSLEQISERLAFNATDGRIEISDVYDDIYLIFWFEKDANNKFHITCLGTNVFAEKLGEADIYLVGFTSYIAQYITKWSIKNNGNEEWRQYAALIADKTTNYLRGLNIKSDRKPCNTPQQVIPPQTLGNIQKTDSSQTGMYYIQIGSYSKNETALSEIAKINKNYSAAIMEATARINGIEKAVFRVLIGPLNYTDSISCLQQLKSKYHDAFIRAGM
ncbi:MAG: SPOR domain-containing protein [Treponema sp.]|nr:SPOR domain-containing protein [Treponema sp.]MCL2272138.1 SPOR domain-containing protein [Treponema sp.]